MLILKTLGHIFCGERWSTKIVFEHWFTYTTPLTRFKGIIKAFSGKCVLTSITSIFLSTNLVEFTCWFHWREWRYCRLVYKFFRINNKSLKCPFVRSCVGCRNITSHDETWNIATELRISVSLGRFTLRHNGRRATQLGRFTLWHNVCKLLLNSVYLLCGTTTVELHNSVDFFVAQQPPS